MITHFQYKTVFCRLASKFILCHFSDIDPQQRKVGLVVGSISVNEHSIGAK